MSFVIKLWIPYLAVPGQYKVQLEHYSKFLHFVYSVYCDLVHGYLLMLIMKKKKGCY